MQHMELKWREFLVVLLVDELRPEEATNPQHIVSCLIKRSITSTWLVCQWCYYFWIRV